MLPLTAGGFQCSVSAPNLGQTKTLIIARLMKAVTWRLTGSIDTLVLSFLITGNIRIAGTISAVEIVTKILLFYFHERVWAPIPWGRRKVIASGDSR